MLFYRFISENLTAYLNEQERAAGNPDFDYVALPDADAEFGRNLTVEEKGFYILPVRHGSFGQEINLTTFNLCRISGTPGPR
jgi:type I restriction-modification system DNA methylase subunit